MKTTPKKESQARKTTLKGSEEEEEEEEDSDVPPKKALKVKKLGQNGEKDLQGEEAKREERKKPQGASGRKHEQNGSVDGKKLKEKAPQNLDSSEEGEQLEKEIDSLLKETRKSRKKKKEEVEDEEEEDSEKEEGEEDLSPRKEEGKGKAHQKGKKGMCSF